MSSTELRSRRTKADLPADDEVLETIALQGQEVSTLIEGPTENLGIISLAKSKWCCDELVFGDHHETCVR